MSSQQSQEVSPATQMSTSQLAQMDAWSADYAAPVSAVASIPPPSITKPGPLRALELLRSDLERDGLHPITEGTDQSSVSALEVGDPVSVAALQSPLATSSAGTDRFRELLRFQADRVKSVDIQNPAANAYQGEQTPPTATPNTGANIQRLLNEEMLKMSAISADINRLGFMTASAGMLSSLPQMVPDAPHTPRKIHPVFARIRQREQKTYESLSKLNARIEELDIQQSYPLSSELLFRDQQAITDHIDPPKAATFSKIDAMTDDERRTLVAKLMNPAQVHHFLRYYELVYREPDQIQPFDEAAILNKAVEFTERYQWVGGSIYVDDATWSVHPHPDDKPTADFSISNTFDVDHSENVCMEKYLDHFCYIMERHFEDLTASYKTRDIKHSNRKLLIVHFNRTSVIEEKRRLRELSKDLCPSSGDVSSDEEYEDNEESASSSRSGSQGNGNRSVSAKSSSEDDRRKRRRNKKHGSDNERDL